MPLYVRSLRIFPVCYDFPCHPSGGELILAIQRQMVFQDNDVHGILPPTVAAVFGYSRLRSSTVYFWNTAEVFLNLKCFVAIRTNANSENSYIDYPRMLLRKTGA